MNEILLDNFEDIEELLENLSLKKVLVKAIVLFYETACELFGIENVTLYKIYENKILVAVKFGDIKVTNKQNEEWMIYDVYAGFSITHTEYDRLYFDVNMLRTKYSALEWQGMYCFSHVPSNFISNLKDTDSISVDFSNVCLGSGLFSENLQMIAVYFNSKETEKLKLEIEELWYILRYNYLTYESIEGGPYVVRGYLSQSLSVSSNSGRGRSYAQVDFTPHLLNNRSIVSSEKLQRNLYELLDILYSHLYITPSNGISINYNLAMRLVDNYFVEKLKRTGVIINNDIQVFIKENNNLYVINNITSLYLNDNNQMLFDYLSNIKNQIESKFIFFKGEKVMFSLKEDDIEYLNSLESNAIQEESNEINPNINLTIGESQSLAIVQALINFLNKNYVHRKTRSKNYKWFSNSESGTGITIGPYEEGRYIEYSSGSNAEDQVSTN